MRSFAPHRGQASLACLTLGVGLLAGLYQGVPTSDLQLHDGGVWVTNLDKRAVAHLNYASRTLDAVVIASSADFDITQDDNTVAMNDLGSGTISAVDTTVPELGSAAALPPGFELTQGGQTVAITDPVQGSVWVLRAEQLDGFSEELDPTIDKAAGARTAVGKNGTAYVVSDSGQLRSVTGAGSTWTTEDLGALEGLTKGGFALTVVGTTPVVLDRAKGEVRTLEETVNVGSDDDVVLQQPGDASDTVALASPNALLLAPLDGGDPTVVEDGPPSTGSPAQPVRTGTCTYAAWGGTGHYQRVCDDNAADETLTVKRLQSTDAQPMFRVNRDAVVLNNAENGDSFLVNENMTLVANWDDVLGQVEDEKQKQEETEQVDQQFNAARSAQNHPPKANPDSFGIRPGRSTTLPVLDNDSDQDGDVLTASSRAEPHVGNILPVRGGEALQIVAGPGAAGADTFTYEARDGRGDPDAAQVQVQVHPWSVNEAPHPKDRAAAVTVASGAEVKYNLLQDWIDPDGDPIYLESVKGTTDIAAQSREDGTVTLSDLGRAKPGLYQIEVRISDGREIATGTLDVDLRGDGNVPPVANADHVIAVVDEETTISPLTNDTDANGDELRLAQVSNPGGGARVLLDPAAGTFSFLTKRAGTVYVEYTVADGPATTKNVVRVDVVDGTSTGEPPVADNDLALLPAGQSVLVPVLANDYDPTGGVLVVQSVQSPPEARLQLDIINHEFVRIRAVGSLRAPVAFTYTIANGVATSTAQVTVINVPDAGSAKPPIVEDDSATVRAGDIVTIPALANDRSPANLDLRIDPKLQVLPKSFPGEAFVAGRNVRFKAGNEPGRLRLTYTVFDSAENYTSGTIVVTVVPKDAPNTPPTPRPLVARVLAGGTVTIPVPTDGVDPEGDSVTLLGVARPAPTKGVVTVVGGSLKYVAPASVSGTDKFRYLVEDAGGAQATGSIRVGIAPPSTTNQLPTAMADFAKVRPGRKVAVPVTANATDPDGDTPILVPDSVKAADKATTTKARTEGAQVLLTTTAKSADLSYYYKITDRSGGQTVDGVLTVQVRANAPLRAPIAQDDVVTAGEVLGKNTATVDVLANDSDPDGVSEDLKVTSSDRGATVAGGKLQVALDEARRVVLYTVTDLDGLTSSAVVTVPGTTDLRPVIDPGAPVVKVVGGENVEIALADHVIVRDGREPTLTFGNTVQPGPGGSAKALSQTDVSFTADASFAGPTAVTLEVTDGKDADDPAGFKATLSIPIEVLPRPADKAKDDKPDASEEAKTPPTFVPTGLQVAAGEDAVSADLRAMVSDPDPGDLDRLKFSLKSVSGDRDSVSVSLEGSTLRAEASADTPAGTSLLASVTVTDGSTDPVEAQVPVNVVSSTRPLMQVQPIEITDANAGEPESVNIEDFVTNPFAADGTPITVLGAESQGGDATGKVTLSGTTVTVTPDKGTHGQITARFSVGDATQDPARHVDGLIRVTVRDRPDASTSVVAASHESGTATITWTAPANNGAVITGYDVQWNGGTQSCGQATSCLVAGLKNAVEYTFTVTATNEVGVSDKSPASNVVKPDQRPDPPSAVSGVFGDRSVKLTWNQPTGDFSAVTSYSIVLSPGDATGRSQLDGITGTSTTVDNLVNGTAYTFRVLAHNEHPEPSDPSLSSAPVIPAGVPFAAAAPTVQKRAASATQPSALVSWNAPDGNGDNNMTYLLKASNGRSWAGLTASSQEVLMDAATTDVTFTVEATNKAGAGAVSAASAPQRFFQKPGPVSNLRAEETGANNTVRITFGAAEGNGASPSEITYRWRAAGATGTLPTTGGTVTHGVFVNGRDVTVEVWATSTVRGETAVGDARSDSANAYGPPTAPTGSHSDHYQMVRFNWNASSSGNGRPVLEVQFRINNGGWQAGPVTHTHDQPTGQGQRVDIEVRSRNEAGWGTSWFDAGTSWAPADYRWRRSSGSVACPVGVSGTCRAIEVELFRYRPGSSVRCYVNGDGAAGTGGDYGVDGNGYRSWTRVGAAAVADGYPDNQVDPAHDMCRQN